MTSAFRAVLFVAISLFASASAAPAQGSPESSQPASAEHKISGEQKPATESSAADSSASGSAAAAHHAEPATGETKEAAEEDENAQFKQSPVVLSLGRKLGLSGSAMYWLAAIVNFAIIALAVIYFSRLHLPTLFRNRTDSIRQAMDEAKRASDDAKKRLAGIEARLGRLDSEISAMRLRAEQDGAAEEARIRAAAEEDKKKIVETAGQEIEVAAKAARRELAAYAADLAVSMARQRIQVDLPADQSLVSSFAQSLGKESQ